MDTETHLPEQDEAPGKEEERGRLKVKRMKSGGKRKKQADSVTTPRDDWVCAEVDCRRLPFDSVAADG